MHLEKILSGRRFRQRTRPFPHLVATDVLAPDAYRGVEAAFREALRGGLSKDGDEGGFSRSVPGYGAYVRAIAPDEAGPLALFVSRAWHDTIAALCDIDATLDVDAALHHHPVGSGNGWVHNDLNPGWFVDNPRPDGVNVSDPSRCSYRHGAIPGGAGAAGSGAPRETVRAAALLFYLANDPWSPGDGGETGLYDSPRSPVSSPSALVPPINNTLLCFPCTPFSCHAFLQNKKSPRNSVILWLHIPKERAALRYGARSIEPWPNL